MYKLSMFDYIALVSNKYWLVYPSFINCDRGEISLSIYKLDNEMRQSGDVARWQKL